MRNSQLWKYYQSTKQDTLCNLLNRPKIIQWLKDFAPRIESLSNKMIALQEKFYETKGYDAKGQLEIVMEEKEVDGKKTITPKLKEGMTNEMYQKEYADLMNEDIVIDPIKIIQARKAPLFVK